MHNRLATFGAALTVAVVAVCLLPTLLGMFAPHPGPAAHTAVIGGGHAAPLLTLEGYTVSKMLAGDTALVRYRGGSRTIAVRLSRSPFSTTWKVKAVGAITDP